MINRVLKLIRQFHELKQLEMAARLGISNSFLSEIEAGKKTPTLDLLERYASEFKVPASTLLAIAERAEGEPGGRTSPRVEKLIQFLEWAAQEDADPRASA